MQRDVDDQSMIKEVPPPIVENTNKTEEILPQKDQIQIGFWNKKGDLTFSAEEVELIQREFEPFYMNRLSNLRENKRKFKDPKPKYEFKPRINKKSIKMAEKRKTKILNLVEFGVR